MPSKVCVTGQRALRPEWKQKCHSRLNSTERDKAIKEVIAVLDPNSSIDEVAILLTERYPNFLAVTWKEYYLEWLKYDGAPPGYGTMNSEPWMSDEIFTKIVNEELAKHGPEPSMTVIADNLEREYGVYSAASYKRHAQNRIGGENPSTVRSGATIHHNSQPTIPVPQSKDVTVPPGETSVPSDKKPTIPFLMATETQPKRSPRLPTPKQATATTTWSSQKRQRPDIRLARKAPPTPSSTASTRSRSSPPNFSAKQLKDIFDTHHHLVKEGMEELRFARWLDRMHSTNHVAYWMNMYDAWIHKDGVFESTSRKAKVDSEDEEESELSESDENWAPPGKKLKR